MTRKVGGGTQFWKAGGGDCVEEVNEGFLQGLHLNKGRSGLGQPQSGCQWGNCGWDLVTYLGAGIVLLKSLPFVFWERKVRQWLTKGKNSKELFFSVSLQSPDSLLPAFQRSLPLTKPQGPSSCHRHGSRFSTWCCTLLPSGAVFRELLGLTLSSSLGLPTPALSGLASIYICRTVG